MCIVYLFAMEQVNMEQWKKNSDVLMVFIYLFDKDCAVKHSFSTLVPGWAPPQHCCAMYIYIILKKQSYFTDQYKINLNR